MDKAKMKQAFTGPVASVTTPFTRDGQVDYEALDRMVEFFISAGSNTMLLTYGDSLYSVLTDHEIGEITRRVFKQTAERSQVVACGGWALPKTLEFADSLRGWGIDNLMLYPPDWAGSCSDDTLTSFYTAVAGRIPIILMTSLRARPLPLGLVDKLLHLGIDIVGIKDDICGDYGRKLASLVDGRCALLSGGRKINHFDQHFYGEVNAYLSVYLRFLPRVAWLYYDAIKNRDYERAVSIIKTFDMPYFDELIAGSNLHFSAVIHASMEIYDICERWQRSPYPSATDAQIDIIRDFLLRMESKLRGFDA